jgi:cellulase/cellobiase CelA1
VFASRPKLLSLLLCVALYDTFLASSCAMAQNAQTVDTSAQNLMVVLRELIGANKQDEILEPMGKVRATLADGKQVEFEIAGFAFVFDEPTSMPNATPQDLARLGANPDQALGLAVRNIKRVYGDPIAKPWTGD